MNIPSVDFAIIGGSGNDTIKSSGKNAFLIGGDNGNKVIVSESGDSTLIGGTGNNTLTGGTGANIFIHQNGADDLITNYDQSEDVIVLASGKVSESLTSDDGKDVILKIADDNGDLGTITIKDAADKILTIYDADYINQCKEVFREFSNAYIKAAVKAFEEDADVQSILTDGENSAVLVDIKAANPELAAQIANAVKLSYEAGKVYADTFVESNSSADGDVLVESSNTSADNGNIGAISAFSNIMSSLGYQATVFSNVNQNSALITGLGKGISKATEPISVGFSITACAAYSAMLYDDNLVPAWQNQGHSDGTLLQKMAKIRSYNSEVFDGWIGSGIDLFFSIGTAAALGIMGIAGAPVIISASAIFAAQLAANWAYKNFIAPQFDTAASELQKNLKDNFADEILEGGEGDES